MVVDLVRNLEPFLIKDLVVNACLNTGMFLFASYVCDVFVVVLLELSLHFLFFFDIENKMIKMFR